MTDEEKAQVLKAAGWRRSSRTRSGPTRGRYGRPQVHDHYWFHPDGRHSRGLGVKLATAWRTHRRETPTT